MTFGRSISGVRVVITPISGALTNGPKKDDAKSTAITPPTGRSSPSSQRGSVSATSDIAPEAHRIVARDDTDRDDAAEHRPSAERAEERACHLGTSPELVVGEYRQAGDEHLPEAVEQERRHDQREQVRSRRCSGHRRRRLSLVPRRERRPLRHEQREQRERDQECGGSM